MSKYDGKVCICIDLTKLSMSVQHGHHILLSDGQIPAQLGGARIFTKLDVNSTHFWQFTLPKESALLNTFTTPCEWYGFNHSHFVLFWHWGVSRSVCPLFVHGSLLAWWSTCMVVYLHGGLLTWWSTCMVVYLRGGPLAWLSTCMVDDALLFGQAQAEASVHVLG